MLWLWNNILQFIAICSSLSVTYVATIRSNYRHTHFIMSGEICFAHNNVSKQNFTASLCSCEFCDDAYGDHSQFPISGLSWTSKDTFMKLVEPLTWAQSCNGRLRAPPEARSHETAGGIQVSYRYILHAENFALAGNYRPCNIHTFVLSCRHNFHGDDRESKSIKEVISIV
jgi:hypothetical protein